MVDAIRNGNRLALARAISAVEDETAAAPALLATLYPYTGRAHIIGITGAPGAGKSTLVTALAGRYRQAGQSVAIVAVDPTSPFTGGALLGDRVRMRTLSGDPGVFVRSMATRGQLGGLSKTTGDVVTLLDAAGFERILVETVGVGQAEIEIAETAHTTVVVEAPGFGDEVQALKAGILEIADLLVVNKADTPGVERTLKALEMMLELRQGGQRPIRHHGQLLAMTLPVVPQDGPAWPIPLLKTVATTGEGVDGLRQQLETHHAWLQASGEWISRHRISHPLQAILQAHLQRKISARLSSVEVESLVEAIRQRTTDPYSVATMLLGDLDSAQSSSG